MNATFKTFLNDIGYKSQANLDWVFTSSDPVKNFFLWLTTNVHRSNVLTTEELNEYVETDLIPFNI